jgi:hypothetical protein
LSNPINVGEITNAMIVQNDQIIKSVTLHKNDEFSYSSEPFAVPSGEFKIFIEGWDLNGSPILREVIADGVIPKDTIVPKDSIIVKDFLDSLNKFIFNKFKGLFSFFNQNKISRQNFSHR